MGRIVLHLHVSGWDYKITSMAVTRNYIGRAHAVVVQITLADWMHTGVCILSPVPATLMTVSCEKGPFPFPRLDLIPYPFLPTYVP